ncbi:unnamed protein product, partial [Heterobilharzia americana]
MLGQVIIPTYFLELWTSTTSTPGLRKTSHSFLFTKALCPSSPILYLSGAGTNCVYIVSFK